jgi:MOSC domain-containing protein YiiM
MKVLAISIGQVRQVEHEGRKVRTGIFKDPVTGPVALCPTGIVGDVQVDRKNHGGPDKAVYVYSADNYPYWHHELGVNALPYGYFGENLTVTGWPDDAVHVGDTFRIGEVILQVTQPRVPCFKLGMKVGDSGFPKRFLASGRVGFYLRVLQIGELCVGDSFERIAEDPGRVSIRDAMLTLLKGPYQQEIITRLLRVEALSAAWRQSLVAKLER